MVLFSKFVQVFNYILSFFPTIFISGFQFLLSYFDFVQLETFVHFENLYAKLLKCWELLSQYQFLLVNCFILGVGSFVGLEN
jgi:hypothetical protein